MNTSDSIATLFTKYLRNECDARELELLSEALKKQSTDAFFDLMDKDWHTFEDSAAASLSFEKGDQMVNRILYRKRVSIFSGKPLRSWAATACVGLLLLGTGGLSWRWYRTRPIVYRSTSIHPLVLPDGSQVQLNQHAQLSYQESFWGDLRRVQLQGEGFFKVFPNKHQPFVIESSNASIRVVGTQFNVRQNKAGLWVAVSEGKVILSNDQGKSVSLVKNQWGQALLDGSLTVENSDVHNYLSWQKGHTLEFKNVAFPVVAKQLERLYEVKMRWPVSMNNIYLTASSRYEPLAQLLPKLSLSLNIHYQIENDTIVFSEK